MERADFLLANLPQFEAAAGGGQQVGGGLALLGWGIGRQLLEATPSDQVVGLRRKELRAIDGEEGLALFDWRTGEVDVQFAHPAAETRGDAGIAAFIVLHYSGGADGVG